MPAENFTIQRPDNHLVLNRSMESEKELTYEGPSTMNRDYREPRHATCHSSSLLNSEAKDPQEILTHNPVELRTKSGELFRQYVEDRIKDNNLYSALEDEEMPLLAFNQASSELSLVEKKELNREEKISLTAKAILEDLVEETFAENQDIEFRKRICPEDTIIHLENGEDHPESGREFPIGIRTNHLAIADFLSLLVDFILDNYTEVVVQKYNAGLEIDAAEAIKKLRQKEILLYSSEAELESYSGFLTDFSAESVQPGSLECGLLDSGIYCALRCELVVDDTQQDAASDSQLLGDAVQFQSIFQKAVFDCFNEVLSSIWRGDSIVDYVKMITCGKQPMVRYLSSMAELEILLTLAKEQVLEHSLTLCGMIKDKDDSIMAGFGNIDITVLNHIREQRLARMLNQNVQSFQLGA
jgi:hypothetical protein